MVWGVNDFDGVSPIPYSVNLTRLTTSRSSQNARTGWPLTLTTQRRPFLRDTELLQEDGNPFILEESHPNLRCMALGADPDPTRFSNKLLGLPQVSPPKAIRRLLKQSLPRGAQDISFSHRIAGVGSLGRPRYLATALCDGGLAAREAKAWLPSAWGWAAGRQKDHAYSNRLLNRAVRQLDPYYALEKGWIVRRIGPHCERIELAQFPQLRDERRILKDMGRETANLHLATRHQRIEILRDLTERKADWLVNAAHAMSKATEQDWEAFRSSRLASRT